MRVKHLVILLLSFVGSVYPVDGVKSSKKKRSGQRTKKTSDAAATRRVYIVRFVTA